MSSQKPNPRSWRPPSNLRQRSRTEGSPLSPSVVRCRPTERLASPAPATCLRELAMAHNGRIVATAARSPSPPARDGGRYELVAHALERWATAVLTVVDCQSDPRTIDLWGRVAGASSSTLRVWCSAAGCGTKASLDFARMLRAITSAHPHETWDPCNVLDVVDRRTLDGLMARSGFSHVPPAAPDADTLLAGHRFDLHPRAGEVIRRRLAARSNNHGPLAARGRVAKHAHTHGLRSIGSSY